MKLINEERTERIIDRDGRSVRCIVRRRGIEAPTDASTFTMHHIIEQRKPVAVVVDDGLSVRRISIDGEAGIPGIAWIMPPAFAIAARLMIRRRKG